MSDLKVEVIGSGGAFDTELVNSSFYVTCSGTKILIDCGYNVFSRLKEHRHDVLDNMDFVIITHMDDDHIGSLKSLLYYRYFILGKTTEVRYADGIESAMFLFLPKNEEMVGNKYVKANIYSMCNISEFKTLGHIQLDNFVVAIKGVHHVDSYGFAIGTTNGSMVVISGDTKANKEFEITVGAITKRFNIKEQYVLHDFSYFDDPSRNPHACKTDINEVYSKEFIKTLNYYHNNKNSLMGTIYNEYTKKLGIFDVFSYCKDKDLLNKKFSIENRDGVFKYDSVVSYDGDIDGVVVVDDNKVKSTIRKNSKIKFI